MIGDIKYCYFERLPTVPSSHPITVLFVHGFSANKTTWMVMSKCLPPDWRLVMVDMPGHGESSFKSGSDYTSRGMSDKLNEVRIIVTLSQESHFLTMHNDFTKCCLGIGTVYVMFYYGSSRNTFVLW